MKILVMKFGGTSVADLEKIAGNFPQAINYKDNSVSEVTVWCSNDYLGMSQNKNVLESMIDVHFLHFCPLIIIKVVH